MQIGAAVVESSMEIPQKIINGSAFWPSDFKSGNIYEGTQITNSKEHMHPYVDCSIIYNCQDMEAAPMSTDRVDKTTVGLLLNGTLVCHKREENFSLWDSMDAPGEYYAKWQARQIEANTHSYVESNE